MLAEHLESLRLESATSQKLPFDRQESHHKQTFERPLLGYNDRQEVKRTLATMLLDYWSESNPGSACNTKRTLHDVSMK